MQRTTAGERLITYGSGLGYGVAAGLVGVALWVLAAGDAAARRAGFRPVPLADDNSLTAVTTFARGDVQFWFSRAPGTVGVMLALCLFAAFTVSWALQRWRNGVVAACAAATVASTMCLTATLVVSPTNPEGLNVTSIIEMCESLSGMVFVGTLIPLAPVVASRGIRTRQLCSRGRRAL